MESQYVMDEVMLLLMLIFSRYTLARHLLILMQYIKLF